MGNIKSYLGYSTSDSSSYPNEITSPSDPDQHDLPMREKLFLLEKLERFWSLEPWEIGEIGERESEEDGSTNWRTQVICQSEESDDFHLVYFYSFIRIFHRQRLIHEFDSQYFHWVYNLYDVANFCLGQNLVVEVFRIYVNSRESQDLVLTQEMNSKFIHHFIIDRAPLVIKESDQGLIDFIYPRYSHSYDPRRNYKYYDQQIAQLV